LDGIILPGGESTTLSLLLEAEDMFGALGDVPKIFGTCAGAIFLAREIKGVVDDQKCLGLIDMEISRNSYGRQLESFEVPLETSLGKKLMVCSFGLREFCKLEQKWKCLQNMKVIRLQCSRGNLWQQPFTRNYPVPLVFMSTFSNYN